MAKYLKQREYCHRTITVESAGALRVIDGDRPMPIEQFTGSYWRLVQIIPRLNGDLLVGVFEHEVYEVVPDPTGWAPR